MYQSHDVFMIYFILGIMSSGLRTKKKMHGRKWKKTPVYKFP